MDAEATCTVRSRAWYGACTIKQRREPASGDDTNVTHHFTVDVEEYFHPTPLESWYPPEEWDGLERRTPEILPRLLDRLDEHDVRGTFFVLGWLAEREPDAIREIARRGHEIASHGWAHRLVHVLGPEAFRESVRRSKAMLEELCGIRVTGYRAPSFSIVPGTEWALEILGEEGYEYDSSLVPTSVHPSYGYPDASPDPHWSGGRTGVLVEVPPSTVRFGGMSLPAGGGAYFRFLPYAFIRAGFRQAEKRGAPGTFYIHPWELDDEPPELPPAPLAVRTRLRGGIRRTWPRIERLLSDFDFQRMDETVRSFRDASAPQSVAESDLRSADEPDLRSAADADPGSP